MRIGYFLSSEEFDPRELVRQARMAEEAGFDGLWISDHFHPWNDEQGHSGFVWSTIGAHRPGHHPGQGDDGRHLPDRAHPPGDRRPGRRDLCGAARGPLRARSRQRRGAQRAHPRRPLAARPTSAWRCSRRPWR